MQAGGKPTRQDRLILSIDQHAMRFTIRHACTKLSNRAAVKPRAIGYTILRNRRLVALARPAANIRPLSPNDRTMVA